MAKVKWPYIFSIVSHKFTTLQRHHSLALTRSHYKGLPEVNDGPQDRKLNPAFQLSRNLMTLKTTLLDGQSLKHGLKKIKKNIAWSKLQFLDSFDKKISKSKSRLLFTIFIVPSNSFHIKCIGQFLGKELKNGSTFQFTNLIKVKIF